MLNTKLGWTLFNLLFVCLYQHILLLWISAPVISVRHAQHGLGTWDVVLAALFLSLVAFEAYVDQTQWNFQREKKRRRAAGEPLTGRYASGFIHDGAWSRSRHPNYWSEQSIWVVFFLFSVVATHRINWTIGGCLLLIGLFQGSSRLSETIQQQRYPAYRDYQRQVPRFLPRPRTRTDRQAAEDSTVA